METRPAQFVRGLYFDIQTIEGVQPLEIWNGVRELFDPLEKTGLVKNLYKIVLPLVNERCYGRPFEVHARMAKATVAAVIAWFSKDPDTRMFERFPYPPTGDGDQKEVYRMVKARAASLLEEIHSTEERERKTPAQVLAQEVFPDGLFDFREMRLVDNELPYIIFTDKEFKVIHGLVIIYLWLLDLDRIFLETLAENRVDEEIIEEYRLFARKVQKENPLTIHGRKMDAQELMAHIREKLKYEDYLDLCENVYSWFEQTKAKLNA
jgi:hypothetical protein